MYCLTATADREGVEYIAVVLHAETSADRFDSARTLLDYAFANYDLASLRPGEALAPVSVTLGAADSVQPMFSGNAYRLEQRGVIAQLSYEIDLSETVEAPVTAGQVLGTMTVYSGQEVLETVDIVASQAVERLGLWDVYGRLLGALIGR
jgi:D-alanyl-D-alanine carboxypeptidase (penicillin-binding protein 5/6)